MEAIYKMARGYSSRFFVYIAIFIGKNDTFILINSNKVGKLKKNSYLCAKINNDPKRYAKE